MGLEWGVIAAITSGATAVYSAVESGKAAERQSRAARAAQRERESAAQKQERLETIQARRDRLQAIRESRIKRASLVAQGESLGVGGSSGIQGGLSSLGSQLGSNIAFSETTAAFGKAIGQDMLNASRIETNATVANAQSQGNLGIANAIGKVAGSYADISSLGKVDNFSGIEGVTKGSQQDSMLFNQTKGF